MHCSIDAAVADLNRSLGYKNRGLLWRTYLARGQTKLRMKRNKSAATDFSTSLRLNRRNPDALNGRARAYLNLARFQNALRDATAAIKLRPRSAFFWHTRGRIYERIGRKKPAIRDYRVARRLAPRNRAVASALRRLGVKR